MTELKIFKPKFEVTRKNDAVKGKCNIILHKWSLNLEKISNIATGKVNLSKIKRLFLNYKSNRCLWKCAYIIIIKTNRTKNHVSQLCQDFPIKVSV